MFDSLVDFLKTNIDELNGHEVKISSEFKEHKNEDSISDYPSGEFNLSSGRILACSPSLENELKNELDKVSPLKKKSLYLKLVKY